MRMMYCSIWYGCVRFRHYSLPVRTVTTKGIKDTLIGWSLWNVQGNSSRVVVVRDKVTSPSTQVFDGKIYVIWDGCI
jgi:hypothetical protein